MIMKKKPSKKQIKRNKEKLSDEKLLKKGKEDFKKFMEQPVKQPRKNPKKITHKKLVDYTKRTKLTKQEIDIVKKSSGNGASSKYDKDGAMSLALVRKLNLARKHAPKFVLFSDEIGRRVFVGDKELMKAEKIHKDETTFLTFNKNNALTFLHGFDEPLIKASFYTEHYKPLNFQSLNL